ncbi:hypothetical protein K461DRAFT_298239 [Myriangium duriaei CBS 260.36]|uniref:Rhodopsin domain-containing protein n=1 Tax=Myriangium duriaei CBS 260.36 TaxID=1168546 RepID=A0A9P4MFQ0_9PEZI|nr:hypothetical protein K461DRAFT_298239 [Myriangium duriaei CBS 260.36]
MSDSDAVSLPDVHATAIIITTAVGLVLATIALALRIYVRLWINRFFGYDDWALLTSYAGLVALSGLQIAYGETVEGDGIITSYDKITLITEWHTFVYAVHQGLLKVALGSFYLRVLQEPWQRRLVIVSTTIFFAYNIGIGLVLLFQCGNPEDVESTNCLPNHPLVVLIYIQAGFNVAMDWFLTLLPISIFLKIQMSTSARMSIGLLMGLGVMASAFSIARIPFLFTSDGDGYEGYAILTRLMILSYYENCLAQIGIAAVALRPLFRKMRNALGDPDLSLQHRMSGQYDYAMRPRAKSRDESKS